MGRLTLRGVRKQFSDTEVIKSVDLDVDDGEFVVFVGPSGCGKSTLLRTLAGLETVTAGAIQIDGIDVTKATPVERGVAMVFQSYALYPHMTVEDNIGFGLRIAGMNRAERAHRVLEAARLLQLEPYLARKPRALSGGQRQRVAIGRAIVKEPKIFLFDEPLSNLDAELRVQMRHEIASLHQRLGATMIYVTHDQVEAMTLADKIVVLRDGKIAQVGKPIELYENPDNEFVAGFIGSPKINLIRAKVTGATDDEISATASSLASFRFDARLRDRSAAVGDNVTIGCRPEHFEIVDSDGVTGTVRLVEQLGSVSFLHLQVGESGQLSIESRGISGVRPNDKVTVRPLQGHVFAFSEDGRRL